MPTDSLPTNYWPHTPIKMPLNGNFSLLQAVASHIIEIIQGLYSRTFLHMVAFFSVSWPFNNG